MTKAPYPGYPPSIKQVRESGGLSRTCLVVDVLSLKPMLPEELAVLQESLEMAIERTKSRLATLESSRVVTPDRFDPLLRTGLRL